MALSLINSLRGYGGLYCGLSEGWGWDLCAFIFIQKSKSSLQYFSMTSCNSVTVVAGFLVSLDEQGPDLMFGVRALS